MKRLYRNFLVAVAWIGFMASLCSCSGADYLNAIPAKSTALISIDMKQVGDEASMAEKTGVLKSLLQVDDVADCGIDISEKLYLFETVDGNLGLCAKVKDEGDLADCLSHLAKKHVCKPLAERKDYHFTVLKDSWVLGFSDKALLVMGPVVADAQAELQRNMVKYLGADEDEGVKASPLFACLDTIKGSMAMVAQAQALPEKFVAPFTLGAPKDCDDSQVLVAANMEVEHGVLRIQGETFSLNERIDKALKEAANNYRPIKGDYLESMPDDALAGIFMNVDGTKFLPMMQRNKSLQTLLMGINAAIDMDNIIRSVNGDMAIIMPSLTDSNLKMMMGARLAHAKWLGDVDYWKQSCPQGGRIADRGKNSYFYTDGKTSFYFGVTDDLQFFSGSDELTAEYSIKPSNHPLSKDIRQLLKGQKLALVVNLPKTGGNEVANTLTGLLAPLFGNINAIVYTLR